MGQLADAVSFESLVRQQGGAGTEMIQQTAGNLSGVHLPGGQSDPDREALGIDDGMDFRCGPAP